MKTNILNFHELTLDQLYAVLRLRSEVFVVEQDCPYNDLDGKDQDAVHVFITEDDSTVIGCLRVFEKDADTVQIGRVVSSGSRRGEGIGAALMTEAVKVAAERFADKGTVYLEAQVYAIGFYEKFGFRVCSEEFLEDGIPHVVMTRNNN